MTDLTQMWQKYDATFQNKRPAKTGDVATLATLGAAYDPNETKYFVVKGFKAGGREYLAGDTFKPADKVQAIKFCQSGYILPEPEYNSAREYEQGKAKHARMKNLFNLMHNAQTQVSRAASELKQAEADLHAAQDYHKQAKNKALEIEKDLLSEFN